MPFNPMPAFFGNSLAQLNQKPTNIYDQETVTRMVAEAVKAEREACAIACETDGKDLAGLYYAGVIRARGES